MLEVFKAFSAIFEAAPTAVPTVRWGPFGADGVARGRRAVLLTGSPAEEWPALHRWASLSYLAAAVPRCSCFGLVPGPRSFRRASEVLVDTPWSLGPHQVLGGIPMFVTCRTCKAPDENCFSAECEAIVHPSALAARRRSSGQITVRRALRVTILFSIFEAPRTPSGRFHTSRGHLGALLFHPSSQFGLRSLRGRVVAPGLSEGSRSTPEISRTFSSVWGSRAQQPTRNF